MVTDHGDVTLVTLLLYPPMIQWIHCVVYDLVVYRAEFSASVSVKAEVDVKNKNEKTLSKFESTSEYLIRPNVQSEDVTKLIHTLEEMSKGKPTTETYQDLSKTAQRVLSDKLDPINAIIVPLASVKAVNKKFVDNPALEVES